jgi:lipoprotein-anchoring transpeptidase ErfK/SrfK
MRLLCPLAAVVALMGAPPFAGSRTFDDKVLAEQIRLDREGFSPGEIDGRAGQNTRRARTSRAAASCRAAVPDRPALKSYTLSADDVAGPFTPLPEDIMEKAKLPALGYSSALEGLAERFHASPALLQSLNPGRELVAGATLSVPDVERPPLVRPARIVVDASDRAVLLLDAAGCTQARFPASMGTDKDPLPIGEWKVTATTADPVFHYNPDLFWDADPAHSKAKVAPGPNNPVGVAWIGLSREHYGIHGTPEPAHIGKTQSHGCIRLTNWDAAALLAVVDVGLPVLLQE